ncbi:MAG: tetratricopeptide repeat protein [Chloroflexota bacterium]|nr:tetratricopeptide repeat protein [Chloroflexota bacterium]
MSEEELRREAEVHFNQARVYNKKGELAAAVTAYQTAEKLFGELGAERERTRCWSGMGKAYGKRKEFVQAAAAFNEAAHHAVLAQWPDKEIEVCYNLGLTLQQMGLKSGSLEQVNEAIEAFQRGLIIAQRIEDQTSAGVLQLSLGFACAWAKQTQEAIGYFETAIPHALVGADFDTAFSALSSLGVLLSNNGRAAEAIPYYQQALELAKSEQGDIVAVADTYANLGVAYEKAGQLDEAIEAMDTYREILQRAGDLRLKEATAMVKRLKNKAKLR